MKTTAAAVRSKLPHVGVTIFTVMTQLSMEHGAINLSQGFPDFDAAPDLLRLVEKAMRSGNNQYAPMQGALPLREAIAAKTAELYGAVYDPGTEITVTAGATQALFAAITAVVRPGDEVIVFEPAYDAYVPVVELNGGIPVFLELGFPEYRIDWDRVAGAITDRTRLMILNFPHNPTGAMFSAEDLAALREVTRDTGVLILSDEVYEHIVFDGRRHESMARDPELAARSFVVSSFGKTYHTTGWKIGYCLAPAPLSREFQRIHQFVTFACNTPIQLAYAEFLKQPDPYLTLSDFYQRKRDTFVSLMEASRFRPLPCRGTYFQLMDYADISDEADVDFAKRLTVEHGVSAIPPSVFYHGGDDHRVLRFCFAKRHDTLAEAAERLCRV